MKIKPSSSTKENQVFRSALSRVLSVSRVDAQPAIEAAKSEKTSKHKKWKYVPEEGHVNP
jgi:hypothetical protein